MLPGLGYLENPPVTIQDNTKILKKFISLYISNNNNNLSEVKEYIVIGHSIGANIAQEIGENNNVCKKVVMINPAFSMNLLSVKRSIEIGVKDIFNSTGEIQGLLANPSVIFGYTQNMLENPIN